MKKMFALLLALAMALSLVVFFATPKCRKLQSKNVGCCNCKMQKVAELCDTAT